MAGKLILTFNDQEIFANDDLSINIDTGVSVISILEIFRNSRLSNYQIELPNPYNKNEVAFNTSQALNYDIQNFILDSTSNDFPSSVLNNVVTINFKNPSWQVLPPTGKAVEFGGVSFSIENLELLDEKTLKINSYSENTSNECSKCEVELTATGGNEIYNAYVDNILISSSQTSPFSVIVDRGIPKNIRVTDGLNELIGTVQTINTRKLIPNDISISLINLSSGTTVSASVEYISEDISNYEYSLDNVNFQTLNTFTGQAVGTKTLYVKDGFGCVTSKSFVIDGVTKIAETVFDISNINSFRFAKIDNEKKNHLNTLSFNQLRNTKYPYYQRFLSDDVITTQFKTNANYINCFSFYKGEQEKQGSENLFLWSNDLSQNSWTFNSLTHENNLVSVNGGGVHFIRQDVNLDSNNGKFTNSLFVKNITPEVVTGNYETSSIENISIYIKDNNTYKNVEVFFNIPTKTFKTNNVSSGCSLDNFGYTLEDDGWIRIFVTSSLPPTDDVTCLFFMLDDDESKSFSGDNINGIYLQRLYVKNLQLQKESIGEYLPTTTQINTSEPTFGRNLNVIKKTSNINNKIKTTCTYFDLQDGKSGIYFGIVDSLDYLTEDVIEQLNYGSSLPQWANKEGDLVVIEGIGQVPVNRISYSDTYNSFILEFDIPFSGNSERIIYTEYNLQPYEIYEFDTSIIDDLFYVVIQVGSDIDNIDYSYISEPIKKVNDSEFLFDISYWDDENKGKFNYQTGIKNKLRIFGYQDDIGEQKTEGYNGDSEYYVTDNVIYDVQRFTFNRLSTEMVNKLRLVFAHKYILINGLYYQLSEIPEVSGDFNYNMKSFSLNLKQGGDKFLTTEQEIITDSPEQQSINIALESAKGKALLLWSKNNL